MARPSAKYGAGVNESLINDLDGLGISIFPITLSWKEAIAIISCAISLSIALIVVFDTKVAVYWGQTNQFIWVGLCLTLMGWCAQLPIRRIFLVLSTSSQASTLQSIDAILRSDPLTSQADWRVRLFLVLMLALGPALSAVYKSLGGGETRYLQTDMTGQFGLTDPLGTHDIGYGLSQFVGVTKLWFDDPGFSNRVYGSNMHVATENMSAMLDSPTADYFDSLRGSLMPWQSKVITATVLAVVCELNAQLDHSIEYFESLRNAPYVDPSGPASQDIWTQENVYHVVMLMPVESDNTNLVIAKWNDNLNESFGSHLLQYSLSRQKYMGTWRVTQSSIELVNAISLNHRVDDHCLLRSNWLSLAFLMTRQFEEYDWRYDTSGRDLYPKKIKSDATLLACMVWSRIVALAPKTKIDRSPNPQCVPEGLPELYYESNVAVETVAITIKPGWAILVVLALYPVLLLSSILFRIIIWPHSPIGEGFGLISLLASVEKGSLALLEGAGLSGKLNRPVFVGYFVRRRNDDTNIAEAAEITSMLKTKQMKSEEISLGTTYY